AILFAASISTECRCPYRKLRAWMAKPSLFAIARTVVESRPPLNRTTAVSAPVMSGVIFTGLLSRESYTAFRRNWCGVVWWFRFTAGSRGLMGIEATTENAKGAHVITASRVYAVAAV